ncbi:GTPase regulator Nrf1 [Mactra antiquata]
MDKKEVVSSVSLRSNKSPKVGTTSRRQSCGTCEGCKHKNCGTCKSCNRFKRTGVMKTRCVERVCSQPGVIQLKVKPKQVSKQLEGTSRRKSCGSCEGCKLKNCGTCKSCNRFKRTGVRKTRCVERVCSQPGVIELKVKPKQVSKQLEGTSRRQSCGSCEGCRTKNCGSCKHCKHLEHKGDGDHSYKCKCIKRVCSQPILVQMKSKKRPNSSMILRTNASPQRVKTGSPRKIGSPLTVVSLKSSGSVAKTPTRQTTQTLSQSGNKVGRKRNVLSEKSVTKKENSMDECSVSTEKNSKTTEMVKLNKSSRKIGVNDSSTKNSKGTEVDSQNELINTQSASILDNKNSSDLTSKLAKSPRDSKAVGHAATAESALSSIMERNLENKYCIDAQTISPRKAIDVTTKDESKLSSSERVRQYHDQTGIHDYTCTPNLKKDIQLPRVKLDSMTKSELKEFIPRLLKLVTGREEVFYSRRSARPEWWPDDVPWAASRADWYTEKYWTDNLKSVVKSCYKYAGKEDLIQSYVIGPMDGSEDVKTGSYPVSPLKMRTFPQDWFLPFSAEIFICFFCEKEFLSKDKMRCHQKSCSERPPDLRNSANFPLPEVGNNDFPPCISPKRPVCQKWSNLSKKSFIENIDLLPKLTAARLREQRPSLEEISCEFLDEIEPTCKSPVTPKTPKSLISQLSHDDSGHGSRKRLSYSLSMDKSEKDKTVASIISDSESESENEADVKKPAHEMNLLDIPISSLLGQRVKNNINIESPFSIVEDSGSFCRTPVKNSFLEKLRKKPMAYPVLYRPRRIANLHKQNHTYRFKKCETKEFMCRINTGLNLKSLEKLKLMKKLRIRVQRLSRKKLLQWMPRKRLDRLLKGRIKGFRLKAKIEVDDVECEFPSGPTLLAKNIDKLLGLKKRNAQNSKPRLNQSLSLSNCVSEELEAEVSKQKLTLYRSLLYEMSVLKAAVVIEDIAAHEKISKESTGADENKKSDYKTLRTMLLSPSASTMPAVNTSTPMSPIRNEKRTQQANDCSFSVISVSSDSESILSSCCQSCSVKKLDGSSIMCCANQTEDPLSMSLNTDPKNTFHKPLHVNVDMPGHLDTDDYGIPSPISVSSESPFPVLPCKTDFNPQGSTISEMEKQESPSSITQGDIANIEEQSIDKVSKLSESDNENKGLMKQQKKLKQIINHGMTTRSCSVTPIHSSIKKITRSASSSLPTSPHRTVKQRLSFDVKGLCEKLQSSQSKSGSTLDSKEKGNLIKNAIRTRSVSPMKNRLPVSSGKASPHHALPIKKVSGNKFTPPDSPVRRLKRKASLPMDKAPPAKLRKVVSDK